MNRDMPSAASWLLATAILFRAATLAAQDRTEPDEQRAIEQELAQIHSLVEYANYRAALSAVTAFVARTDLDAQARNAGLELLAIVHLALRDDRSAQRTLAELYSRDPAHRLGDLDASPVVQSAFARARQSARPIEVTIAHEPPVLARRESPRITVRVSEGANAVHEVRLAYRHAGTLRWTTVVLPLEGAQASGSVPLVTEGDAAYSVDYYLEAIAPSSHVLGQLGSQSAPLRVEVPAAAAIMAARLPSSREPIEPVSPVETGNVLEEPWLWVVIGAVAVGAGVGIGVGVHYGTQGSQSGSLGEITLPLFAF